MRLCKKGSSPIQACEHLDFLRTQVSPLLVFVANCIHRFELAFSAASHARAGAFDAFLDPIPFHTEDVQLRIRAADMERVWIFPGRRCDRQVAPFSGKKTG
jgi:hypothetical protein